MLVLLIAKALFVAVALLNRHGCPSDPVALNTIIPSLRIAKDGELTSVLDCTVAARGPRGPNVRI